VFQLELPGVERSSKKKEKEEEIYVLM